LNWLELEKLSTVIGPEVEGLFIDRIVVPERDSFPDRYLKGEWVIRLTGKRQECYLLFSIRPRQPYLAWNRGKGPKASTLATRSPFDLSVSKYLKGAKLLQVQAIKRERSVILWFSEEGNSEKMLGLVLVFIPTAPEALLVSAPKADLERSSKSSAPVLAPQWPILARSRTIRDEKKQEFHYSMPSGAQAPDNPVVRFELFEKPDSFIKRVESELQNEAFQARLLTAQKSLRQLLKQASDRMRQSQTALREAQNEENWQKMGDLLKSSLGNPPPLKDSVRHVVDYETDEEMVIRCDPKLNLIEQVEKFYQNSRRRQRRIQEATSRMEGFQETITRLEKALAEKIEPLNWSALARIEKASGVLPQSFTPKDSKQHKKNSGGAWLGKSFTSKDGLTIWVGRSKDENLELTFKHARGNDLWLHVRGRPGAHAVIPIPSGKSAPLDTLLDAAQLVIYYSGGENWGKTEVDYTFKKYVKRIKDSTEASYTNNKTLIIQPDSQRIKKLLEQNAH
jgi:predicted ribosome quality control (RQC) complex YloA/Tae2 family protein